MLAKPRSYPRTPSQNLIAPKLGGRGLGFERELSSTLRDVDGDAGVVDEWLLRNHGLTRHRGFFEVPHDRRELSPGDGEVCRLHGMPQFGSTLNRECVDAVDFVDTILARCVPEVLVSKPARS